MTDPPAEPVDAAGWGALGDRLRLEGDARGADRAYVRQLRADLTDPDLIAAADALSADDAATAHRLLSALLARRPSDTAALRMFADLAARSGRHHDAELLLKSSPSAELSSRRAKQLRGEVWRKIYQEIFVLHPSRRL